MPERLQKILARHGLGSRREIERWIVEGRVTVNRKPAQIGDQFIPGDRVAIDGKEVTARLNIEVAPQVLMFHKAHGQPIQRSAAIDDADTGIESDSQASDDTGETVMERLPSVRGARWVPINPMHPGDSGLLLLTNDGNLSYALTRRKRWIPTTYMVRVLAPRAEIPPEVPPHVSYDSGHGAEEIEFTTVEPAGGEGSNLWYRVVMPRADHRSAVRALFASRDLPVSRLTQVAFGAIELPRDLSRGRHRALDAQQLAALYELAQVAAPKPDVEKKPISRVRKKPVAPDRRRNKKPHTLRRGAAADAPERATPRSSPRSPVNRRKRR